MFAGRATLRQGVRRTVTARPATRGMAGGKYLYVSPIHKNVGEFFGVVCWLWVFHRARTDLAIMYGAHPWEHGHDDHGHSGDSSGSGGHDHHVASSSHESMEFLEKFNAKAMIQKEVDDDDDDEDEDED